MELSRQVQAEIGNDQQVSATLVFDYPRICDLAVYLVDVLSDRRPEAQDDSAKQPSPEGAETLQTTRTPDQNLDSSSTSEHEVASLSEEEALEALLRELKE